MTEADRLRFLRQARESNLISEDDYDELIPRMVCRDGSVLRTLATNPSEGPAPASDNASRKKELVRQLAQCVIEIVRQQAEPKSGAQPTMRNNQPQQVDGRQGVLAAPVGDEKTVVPSKAGTPAKFRRFAFPAADKELAPPLLDPLQV